MGRRALLGSAALAAGGVLASAGSAAADTGNDGPHAKKSFTVTDKRGRQRFLLSSVKPPTIVGGEPHPRSGPDDASWFVFNDETGDERGGMYVSPAGGKFTFDYPRAIDGISLALSAKDGVGGAGLEIKDVPPAGAVQATSRVLLGCHTMFGAQLSLADSQGRPRIVLRVDEHDEPSITVLDANGAVVRRLA